MLTTCHRFELDLDREIADQLEYGRLGFDPVGVATGLIRKPPGHSTGDILPA